jgi:hypothetical protein
MRNQVERLLGNDLAAIGQEYPHSHAPTHADQLALIAERRGWQIAVGRLFISESSAAKLVVGQAVEVMNMQVFVTFAFGVPQHRCFQTVYFI